MTLMTQAADIGMLKLSFGRLVNSGDPDERLIARVLVNRVTARRNERAKAQKRAQEQAGG